MFRPRNSKSMIKIVLRLRYFQENKNQISFVAFTVFSYDYVSHLKSNMTMILYLSEWGETIDKSFNLYYSTLLYLSKNIVKIEIKIKHSVGSEKGETPKCFYCNGCYIVFHPSSWSDSLVISLDRSLPGRVIKSVVTRRAHLEDSIALFPNPPAVSR